MADSGLVPWRKNVKATHKTRDSWSEATAVCIVVARVADGRNAASEGCSTTVRVTVSSEMILYFFVVVS